MPKPFTILLETVGNFACRADERVIVAMERQIALGLAASSGKRIPVGCRRGGCGICRVEVLDGAYRTDPMSRTHVSETDERNGIVLACCLYPGTDLSLRLRPKPDKQSKS